MRYAVIDGNAVVNVIEAPKGFTLDGFILIPSDTAGPGWTWDSVEFAPPPPPSTPPVPPPTASTVASGIFSVTGGWLESIGAAAGIGMAFPLDVGTYWLFFTDAQPDLSYAVYASASQGVINVSARSLEYVELTVRDGNGNLLDPSEFSINIVRAS